MSISIARAADGTLVSIIVTGETDVAHFEHLLTRGINTWDQAPASMKELVDKIRYGYPLQDYYKQSATKPRPE